MFRRMLSPTVKGKDGGENKQAIKDDAPEPKEIPFKVNAEYPKEAALSTVPTDVLLSLPPLPKDKEVEYRFAGKHLISVRCQGQSHHRFHAECNSIVNLRSIMRTPIASTAHLRIRLR